MLMTGSNWLDLYREAVLEPDYRKSQLRIVQAQRAIELRARELWYAGVSDTTERRRMDTALHFLEILSTIGASK